MEKDRKILSMYKSKLLKEVQTPWQNAISAERALLSALRFLTHTDVQTEHSSPMFRRLRLS